MKRYEIEVPVVAVASYIVEAESIEEAIELVASGEVDIDEYINHEEDPDSNNWEVMETFWD